MSGPLVRRTPFRRVGFAALALALTLGFALTVPVARAAAPEGRPRIGLVLSGGGALGATHVGVLKVLEELRIPVDVIAGTSMGSIVGGLYAMGLTANELESLVATIDWADAFADRPERGDRSFRSKSEDYGFLLDLKVGLKDGGVQLPAGLIQGQKLTLMLRALTLRTRNVTDFDQLPIRYRAVAADLETGRAVVLGRGNLATAMRASMSVPGVFPPVDLDGKLLVDGGVANNLPVDVARAMGADVLIVVDIPSVLKKRNELTSTVDIAGQMLTVLIQQNSLLQLASLGPRDILIQPDLGTMGSSDFGRIMDAVGPGEAAARKVADRLRALTMTPEAYAADKTARGREEVETPVIHFVEIVNKTGLSDRRIRSFIRQKVGEPLDVAQVEQDFTRLYGLGNFEQIDYALVTRDGRAGMVVTATEKSWAKDYLRAGLALEHDLSGDSSYVLGLGINFTALNAYGAEWRNQVAFGSEQQLLTEFYQPLQPEPGLYLSASASYTRDDTKTWVGGAPAAEYRITQYGGAVFLGHELGTIGDLRLGYTFGAGEVDRRIGTAGPDDFDFTYGRAVANLTVDTVDNLGFPSRGLLAVVNLAHADPALGADERYTRIEAAANQAISFGRNRVLIGGRAGTALDGDLPVYHRFSVGGLFNVSGYARDEISTANLAMGRFTVMRALNETTPLAFNLPLYAGLSVEAAAVDDDADGGNLGRFIIGASLFAAADTPLGPLYVGYGRADGGRQAAYLYFGKMF
ncbi:patatin-like phospholipase family protein [Azospirillum halopraeferens]|uniref:patatin-like phospholipase family protein n=1 Tax=Azospirillum halopraeferens TaxID=34010 RepID=UPI000A01BAE5|nr:patatin-like phospholipase family protein [Azospirillum halopraeferens]